jgi:polysaccharide export outer membrane protein
MNTRFLRKSAAVALAMLALPLAALGQAAGGAAPTPSTTAINEGVQEYLIVPGDVLRITVYQNADLTQEARVAEDGTISFPLIGGVAVAGLSVGAVEKRIAQMLRDGKFIVAPHVTVALLQERGNQVTVLGMVGKPGRYPIDSTDDKLTDVLAAAGGIAATGADVVVLTGVRNGQPVRIEINLQELAASGDPARDVHLKAGDLLFVGRAPSFYIYGEVQKPGSYRIERGMTVMQALATGGGLTPKGTQRGLNIHRRGADGSVKIVEPNLDDPILPDDVLYIKESLF